jgi:hypothetical protein
LSMVKLAMIQRCMRILDPSNRAWLLMIERPARAQPGRKGSLSQRQGHFPAFSLRFKVPLDMAGPRPVVGQRADRPRKPGLRCSIRT